MISTTRSAPRWRPSRREGISMAQSVRGRGLVTVTCRPPARGSPGRERTSLNVTPANISSALFFFNDPATTEIYTLSLHDALPIFFGRKRLIETGGRVGVELVHDQYHPLGPTMAPLQKRANKHGPVGAAAVFGYGHVPPSGQRLA